jgi:hypothetical protein
MLSMIIICGLIGLAAMLLTWGAMTLAITMEKKAASPKACGRSSGSSDHRLH